MPKCSSWLLDEPLVKLDIRDQSARSDTSDDAIETAAEDAESKRRALEQLDGSSSENDRDEAASHRPSETLDAAAQSEEDLKAIQQQVERIGDAINLHEVYGFFCDQLRSFICQLQGVEADGPGVYIMTRDACVTAEPDPESEKVGKVTHGSSQRVVEVCHSIKNRRVCGRLEPSDGLSAAWISLYCAEETDRSAIKQPCCGSYHIIFPGTVVTAEMSKKSEQVDQLGFGSTVNVLEVCNLKGEGRIRGRIEAPPGWISLVSTDSGQRWVRRCVESKSSASSQVPEQHCGVECDGCRMYPLTGKRFKCITIDDFNFCAACTAKEISSNGDFIELSVRPISLSSPVEVSKAVMLEGICHAFLQKLSSSYAECEKSLQRALEVFAILQDEDKVTLPGTRLEACGFHATLLQEGGWYKQAAESHRKAIELEPSANRYVELGGCTFMADDSSPGARSQEAKDARRIVLEAAAQSFRQALELDPCSIPAHIDLNRVLEELGEIEAARNVAYSCIRGNLGFWQQPLQRPQVYLEGLSAKPFQEGFPCKSSVCTAIDAQVGGIRQELLAIVADEMTPWRPWQPSPGIHAPLTGNTMDFVLLLGSPMAMLTEEMLLAEALSATGDSAEQILAAVTDSVGEICESDSGSVGTGMDASCEEAMERAIMDGLRDATVMVASENIPITAAVLGSVPAVSEILRLGAGRAGIVRLAPGQRVGRHCGQTNLRLTCVLALAGQCMLHVGECTSREISTEKGNAFVFDDSFEHCFANPSDEEACAMLLVHLWHPGIKPEHWQEYAAQLGADLRLTAGPSEE